MSESVFAPYVEYSVRSKNSLGNTFTERAYFAESLQHHDLEDVQRFHERCEWLRLKMLDTLRTDEPGPINCWRVGQMTFDQRPEGLVLGIRTRAKCELGESK